MTRTQRFMTAAEVAAELRWNIETVRRWCRSGKLPALDTPAGYRIARADFEQLLADMRRSTPLTKGAGR